MPAAQAQELAKSIQTLWERHSSDDLVSLFLVLIDAFVVKARAALQCTPQCSAVVCFGASK